MPSSPIQVAGMTIEFLLDPDETGESVSVFRCEMPAGAHVPVPHSHDAFDETIYGLRGVTTYTVDGEPTRIEPGDALFIPRGAVHGFAVDGDESASMLCVATPGRFGPAYFREMAEVIEATGDGPPDREALMAVMQRHGLTPAVPSRA